MTADAGRTWMQCEQPVSGFDAVSFIDEQRGWALINGVQVWYTGNGGRSWKALAEVSRADGASPGRLETIRFIDERHGWIAATLSVWKTDDGGAQWREQVVHPGPDRARGILSDCYFANSDVGWVTGTQGTVSKTEDGGTTWQSQNITSGYGDILDISFVNDRTGWLAVLTSWKEQGASAGIYATDNGGAIWKPQVIVGKSLTIKSVCFVNEKEGWAAGIEVSRASTGETSHAVLLHTEDGGGDWKVLYTGQPSSIGERVYFANSSFGLLLVRSDQDDSLYRTTDGGNTWDVSLKRPLVDEEQRVSTN